jgi:uncharacterized membrane protein YczE
MVLWPVNLPGHREVSAVNKLLAGTVRFLNGVFAISFVVIGAIIGGTKGDPGYIIIGAAIGFIVAAFVCGILALVIDMRNELVKIREALEQRSVTPRDRAA